jgi:LmbE family N-acetylglucosaminyl deacetylase
MVQVYTGKVRKIKGAKVLKNYKGKTVLAFSPHSDDLSICAGGFLFRLAKENKVIPVLGFTGWRGVSKKVAKKNAIALREKEMKKEAKVLGMEKPVYMGLDSYDKDTAKNRRKDKQAVKDVITKVQPDVILVPSRADTQPRHKLLTDFVVKALKNTDKEVTMVYYETPWSLFEADQINLLVPLSKEVKEKKMKGVKSHKSQLVRNDFIKISKAMLEHRALVLPEQLIGGFGSKLSLGSWMEVFSFETVKRTK